MFGYGTGTGTGGVLQTSGNVALETPPLPLWQSESPLTLMVTLIVRSEGGAAAMIRNAEPAVTPHHVRAALRSRRGRRPRSLRLRRPCSTSTADHGPNDAGGRAAA